MKIWCVDHAGLSHNIYSELLFTKEEAQDRYDSLYAGPGSYRKMYQVEDIWHWCARNFEKVLYEIIASRDSGEDYTYIWGMLNEIKEAAEHCGVENFSADMIIAHEDGYDPEYTVYVLSVAWFQDGKMHHQIYKFYGIDTPYNYPTIVERRSKYEKVRIL
jgi:hypothetical protein